MYITPLAEIWRSHDVIWQDTDKGASTSLDHHCGTLYHQWRQRECNFGGDAEGIKEQLRGITESPYFIGRQRWHYTEHRGSL